MLCQTGDQDTGFAFEEPDCLLFIQARSHITILCGATLLYAMVIEKLLNSLNIGPGKRQDF